jgi:hypothetical protein
MRRLIEGLEEANEAGVTIRVLKDVMGKDKDRYNDRDLYSKFLSNYPADLQKKLLDFFDKKKDARAKLEKQLRSEQDAIDAEGSKYGRWFTAKNGKDVEWKTADEIEKVRKNR